MTGVYLDIDGHYLDVPRQAVEPINIYGDVSLSRPTQRVINCRTCQHAGMGCCTLDPGKCSSGSAYVAAPVLRFWSQS